MRVVNESELAERKALLKSLGLDLDPYASIRETLARLDNEVAKLETRVDNM